VPQSLREPSSLEPEYVRVRIRRRRSRHRPRGSSALAVGLTVLLGCAVFVAIPASLLTRDLLVVRGALQSANGSLHHARAALGDIEVEAARGALLEAETELSRARSRVWGPLWSVAAEVPAAGTTFVLTREIVEVASAAVDVARATVDEGGPLLGRGLTIPVADGVLDLEPLLHAREVLSELPTERLAAARDQLAVGRAGWVPAELGMARTETLRSADEVLDPISRGRSMTTALPAFFGAHGPRRYFVGMQSSAELRGTGGLIGYWAVITVEQGRLSLEGSDVYDEDGPSAGAGEVARTGYIGSLSTSADGGTRASPEFHARYDGVGATSVFANVNVDPDLPTTAEVALDLFELRTGERLDGLILLDPVGLEGLLRVTGPSLPLPSELMGTLGAPNELATERFARSVTVDIYERLGAGRGDERAAVLRALGDQAFQRILAGAWDGTQMVRAVADISGERHLQVYSRDPAEQDAFKQMGVDGALDPEGSTDLLAVTANNIVGGKQDVHLGHRFDVAVRLDDVRRDTTGPPTATRHTTVQVSVENPLPAAGMDEYIIGNCVAADGSNDCFAGPPGWNWTWFSTWFPGGTQLRSGSAADGVAIGGPEGYRGLVVVDHRHPTPPGEEASFSLEATGTVELEEAEAGLVYELLWWRQSKAVPDLLDVRVVSPDGWTVEHIEVEGGGSGRGMGVDGAGVDLEVDVEADVAVLRGTVTADLRLRVHLSEARG
jgi:hypothetical protein